MKQEHHVSALVLRNVPLFAALSEDEREIIATSVRRVAIRRGASIIEAGELSKSLYVLQFGEAKVVIRDPKGGEVILAIMRPGDYFGEMRLIDDKPRSASVIARENCELLTLGQEEFRACLREHPEILINVTRVLVKRLRDADQKIGSLALLDVYGRVAQLLLSEVREVDGERVIPTKLSKQDIANMVGASREMVSRVMKDLEARRFIEQRGQHIALCEPFVHED